MPLLRSLPAPRLEIGARVYKGAPHSGGGKLQDLDYFRVEFTDKYQFLADWFHERYPQPKILSPIYLAGNAPEDVFDASREQWGKSGLKIRCNEVYQELYLDDTLTYVRPDEASAPRCQHVDFGGPGCECVKLARLRFVLPDAIALAGRPFVFQLTTHSIHDINEIYSVLEMVHASRGSIGGLPFVLSRETEQIRATITNKEGQKQRIQRPASLVKLSLPAEVSQGVFGLPDASRLPNGEMNPELPAPAEDWLELTPLQIELNPIKSGYQYIVRCDGLQNPVVMFNGDVYRKAGFDVDEWKERAENNLDKRTTIKFEEPHTLIARLEGQGDSAKWVVREIV